MLIIHKNCIAYDHLDPEDLQQIQNPAKSHDDERCWYEILDGDESIQRSLGESYTWQEILEGDYSSKSDVIIAPSILQSDVLESLQKLGFHLQESYYSGEDRYYFEGNEIRYLKPGRRTGFSPINGEGGAMIKKNKAWSMPDEDWDWLESQPNQSEVIRSAIALYRQKEQ